MKCSIGAGHLYSHRPGKICQTALDVRLLQNVPAANHYSVADRDAILLDDMAAKEVKDF